MKEPTHLAAPNANLGESAADVIVNDTLDGEAHRAVPKIVDFRDSGTMVSLCKRRMAHRIGWANHRQRPPSGLAKPGDPGESSADTSRSSCGPHRAEPNVRRASGTASYPEPCGRGTAKITFKADGGKAVTRWSSRNAEDVKQGLSCTARTWPKSEGKAQVSPAAPWRSGYAAACKAVYAGSNPAGAFPLLSQSPPCAGAAMASIGHQSGAKAPPLRSSKEEKPMTNGAATISTPSAARPPFAPEEIAALAQRESVRRRVSPAGERRNYFPESCDTG